MKRGDVFKRQFFERRELAKLFGVSSRTIGRWVSSGRLRATRLSEKRVVFNIADVLEFVRLAAGVQFPVPSAPDFLGEVPGLAVLDIDFELFNLDLALEPFELDFDWKSFELDLVDLDALSPTHLKTATEKE